ncbi:MAG TPA: TlpA disulfide reductase family protein [Methyloradius sp.]
MLPKKLRRTWPYWIAGTFLLFLAGLIYLVASEDEAPNLSLLSTESLYAAAWPDSLGQTQALSQWKNKVSVVNFWASWCQPCREEMPDLSAVYDKYAAQGLVVLGISVEDHEKMAAYTNQIKVSYPLLAADMEGSDMSDNLGNYQGVLPYTVIIDANGKIIKSFSGSIDQAILEAAILPLITAP